MNQKRLPDLPIGVQTFDRMRTGKYVYVDKTQYVYELARTCTPYFLSRPRRFGKSLLVSTFKALFEAKKHLFEGTWLASSDWQWQKHPVVFLDISSLGHNTPEYLIQNLKEKFLEIASDYGVVIQDGSPGYMLNKLVINLARAYGPVVFLVDEYDKPIISKLHAPAQSEAFKAVMKDLYQPLKSLEACLRFVFLTGVSAFTSVSIFSDLNHLKILSAAPTAALLCGYTQEELESSYPEHIQLAMKRNKMTKEQLLEQMKFWYNGYSFTEPEDDLPRVYNPYSVINFFSEQRFANYWFTSGTPTFALEYARSSDLYPADLDGIEVKPAILNSLDTNNISITTVLYQSGYLTIKEYNARSQLYTLGFPNHEVSVSCVDALFRAVMKREPTALSKYAIELSDLFLQHTLTEERLKMVLAKICAEVPHTVGLQLEKDFQRLLWMALQFSGLEVRVEEATSLGSMDAVIMLNQRAYILELKVRGSAQKALQQIEEKRYEEKYANQGFAITKIGILFDADPAVRTVTEISIK